MTEMKYLGLKPTSRSKAGLNENSSANANTCCITHSWTLTVSNNDRESMSRAMVKLFQVLTFFSRRIPSCVCPSVTISNMPCSSPSIMLYVDLALSPMSLSFAFTLPPILPIGRSSGITNSYKPVEE